MIPCLFQAMYFHNSSLARAVAGKVAQGSSVNDLTSKYTVGALPELRVWIIA
jgi:hypothetical protein